MNTDFFKKKSFFQVVFAICILSFSFECTLSQYYDLRSHFLSPVNYTGGLCRVTDDTQGKLLTQELTANDPSFVKKISRILSKQAPYFSISMYDPDSGYTIRLNHNQLYHAASTYKAAILVAVMRMDQEGKLSINDRILVENRFESIVDGSAYSVDDDPSEPDITFTFVGNEVPIKDLLNVMIEKSSNLATNILVKYIGADKINETLRDSGSRITVARGVSDDKAYADCINNLVSAYDLEILYQVIYDDDKVNQQHREMMLETLEKSSEINRLPAKLPETVKVAHKPGNTSKVFHDAGIVIPETGSPYYITILTSQYKSERKTAKAIAEVSLMIYQEVLKARMALPDAGLTKEPY